MFYREEEKDPTAEYQTQANKHFKDNIDWYMLQWLHVLEEDEVDGYLEEAQKLLLDKPFFVFQDQKDRRPPSPFLLFNSDVYQDHFSHLPYQTHPEVLLESSERWGIFTTDEKAPYFYIYLALCQLSPVLKLEPGWVTDTRFFFSWVFFRIFKISS